jgi:hypothetical protein
MSSVRDVALVDELRALPAETPWVEFKGNNTDPDMIGKRCSALSNAARIEGKDCAYMLWGIADDSHAVIGTEFNPEAHKGPRPSFSALAGELPAAEHCLRLSRRRPPCGAGGSAGNSGGHGSARCVQQHCLHSDR